MWLGNGWLKLYPEKELGPPKELIPLMAVVQDNKSKVHPSWILENIIRMLTHLQQMSACRS